MVPDVLPCVAVEPDAIGLFVSRSAVPISDLTSARVAGTVGFCADAKPDASSNVANKIDCVACFISFVL